MTNKAIHFATGRFKTYREARNWTQQQMANFLTLQMNQPVSRQDINYWEAQRRGMNAEKALMICDITHIPIMELVERKNV